MKRATIALTLLALLAALATAGAAQADRATPPPNCGSSNSNFGVAALWAHYVPNNEWQVSWAEYCGVGGTVTVEMQRTTDSGQHWTDMGGMTDSVFTQQHGGQGESRIHTYNNTTYSCSGDPNVVQYRLHVWANANATTGGPYYHADDITPVICPYG